MAPLLQNLCLSMGDNEEACFCLKVKHTDDANNNSSSSVQAAHTLRQQ